MNQPLMTAIGDKVVRICTKSAWLAIKVFVVH